MASVVQTQRFTGSNSGTLTTPLSAGSTLVVVFIGSAGAGSTGTCSTSGATLGGVPMVKLHELNSPTNAAAGCIAWYIARNVTGGQTAIVVSGTSLVAADSYICAYELGGMGTFPYLHQVAALESHSGTTSWSSDGGTAPATTQPAVWLGAHGAGPNSGQPDTFTPAGSWTNQTQFNWGSPGGASISGHQIAAAGSLRYNGTSADFDFYLTSAIALVQGDTYVRPGGKYARKRRRTHRTPVIPEGLASSSPIPIALTDTGTADDTTGFAVTAGVALADAGTSAEALAVTSGVALSDAGTGADVLAVSVPIALTDAGAGTDSLAVALAIPLAEAGTGTDALAVTAGVSLTDAGTGTAALAVTAGIALTDTGTGTTALAVTIPVALAEAGAGTDVLAISVPIALAEAGTGTDALAVIIAQAIALAEAGIGTDVLAVSSGVGLGETGTSTDVLTIAAAVALAEAGASSQALAVTAAVALTDAGMATDAVLAAIPIALTDAGHGADALTVVTALAIALSDAGHGTDALGILAAIALTATGAGSDALTVEAITAAIGYGTARTGSASPGASTGAGAPGARTGKDAPGGSAGGHGPGGRTGGKGL